MVHRGERVADRGAYKLIEGIRHHNAFADGWKEGKGGTREGDEHRRADKRDWPDDFRDAIKRARDVQDDDVTRLVQNGNVGVFPVT